MDPEDSTAAPCGRSRNARRVFSCLRRLPAADPNCQREAGLPGQTRAPEQKLGVAFDVVTVAEGLANPWGLTFLPDGRMLVTEKPGRLRIISADGKQMSNRWPVCRPWMREGRVACSTSLSIPVPKEPSSVTIMLRTTHGKLA
jgi:glucose/arabinose dehydrogenase